MAMIQYDSSDIAIILYYTYITTSRVHIKDDDLHDKKKKQVN